MEQVRGGGEAVWGVWVFGGGERISKGGGGERISRGRVIICVIVIVLVCVIIRGLLFLVHLEQPLEGLLEQLEVGVVMLL